MTKQNYGITKKFAFYVSLNVLGMLGMSFYILADTFFIAWGIGGNGLAALNLGLPVFSLISGIGLMIGIGGAARFSMLRGSGEAAEANRVFSATLTLSLLFSVVLLLVGLFGSDILAKWLGADHELMPLSVSYIKTILLFTPAFLFNNLLLAFIRNDGNPRLVMAAMLTGSAANIILDYLFIFPFQMGMFGAALATGLSPVIGILVMSIHFFKKQNNFHFSSIVLSTNLISKIFALGIPSFITEFSSGIIILLFNLTILRLAGNVGVAAYAVIANIALIAVAMFTGVGQGIQPLVSYGHGAGEHAKTHFVLKLALLLVFVVGFLAYFVLIYSRVAVVGWFNRENDAELLAIAQHGTWIYFLSLFFMGSNVVGGIWLASVEQAWPSFAVSFLRGFGMIIPLLLILPFFFGLNGVWLVIPCAEFATFAITAFFIIKRFRTCSYTRNKIC